MSVGSTPLPRIPPGFPWRPRRRTESPAGWRDPAEELPRPDERSDARRGRRVTILLGVTDVRGCAQAHAVETGQLEEHPGSGLAAVAAVRVRVGAEPAVGGRSSELLVGPGEPPQNLGLRDFALRDGRAARHRNFTRRVVDRSHSAATLVRDEDEYLRSR